MLALLHKEPFQDKLPHRAIQAHRSPSLRAAHFAYRLYLCCAPHQRRPCQAVGRSCSGSSRRHRGSAAVGATRRSRGRPAGRAWCAAARGRSRWRQPAPASQIEIFTATNQRLVGHHLTVPLTIIQQQPAKAAQEGRLFREGLGLGDGNANSVRPRGRWHTSHSFSART